MARPRQLHRHDDRGGGAVHHGIRRGRSPGSALTGPRSCWTFVACAACPVVAACALVVTVAAALLMDPGRLALPPVFAALSGGRYGRARQRQLLRRRLVRRLRPRRVVRVHREHACHRRVVGRICDDARPRVAVNDRRPRLGVLDRRHHVRGIRLPARAPAAGPHRTAAERPGGAGRPGTRRGTQPHRPRVARRDRALADRLAAARVERAPRGGGGPRGSCAGTCRSRAPRP